MSLMGYFSKRDEFKIGMPQSLNRQQMGAPDNLGIRYEGPVLNGEISPQDFQREVAQHLALRSSGAQPPAGRVYTNADPQWWGPGLRGARKETNIK